MAKWAEDTYTFILLKDDGTYILLQQKELKNIQVHNKDKIYSLGVEQKTITEL